jgi:hypothetical protein
MIKNQTNLVTMKRFLIISHLILLLFIFGGSYYYYQSRLSDNHYITSVYQKSATLEELVKADYLKKISGSINKLDFDNATKLFSNFELKTTELFDIERILNGNAVSTKITIEIKEKIRHSKKNLAKILSGRNFNEYQKDLVNKINQFQEYSTLNNWQTLSKMSLRMLVKSKEFNNLDLEKLRIIQKSLTQDISIIKNIAETSTLNQLQIDEILNRSQLISNELIQAKVLVDELDEMNDRIKDLSDLFQEFIVKALPNSQLDKIILAEKNRNFMIGQIFLMVLLFIIISSMIYISKTEDSKNLNKFEKDFLLLVKNYIMGQSIEDEKLSSYSNDFKNEINKLKESYKIKISSLNKFQDGIPFPSCIVDNQFNVVWSNNLFCNVFALESVDISRKLIHWDLVSRFTNLSTQNPIKHSIKENSIQVNQIKINIGTNDQICPYEMYSVPLRDEHLQSVFVIFYPLSSLNDALVKQSLSLVGPINDFIEEILSKKITNEVRNEFLMKFNDNGIKYVYDNFIKLTDKIDFLVKKVDVHEKNIKLLKNMILNSFKDLDINETEINKKIDLILIESKNQRRVFIDNFEIENKLLGEFKRVSDKNFTLISNLNDLIRILMNMKIFIQDFNNSIDVISSSKIDTKKSKVNINVLFHKIETSLDQLNLFLRNQKDLDSIKYEALVEKIKLEKSMIQQEFQTYDTKMVNVDIQTSKLSEIVKGIANELNLAKLNDRVEMLKISYKELQEKNYLEKEFSNKLSILEESSIKSVKNILQNLMDLKSKAKNIKLISQENTKQLLIEDYSKAPIGPTNPSKINVFHH